MAVFFMIGAMNKKVLFIVLNVEMSFNDEEDSKVNYCFDVSFCGVHPLERWYLNSSNHCLIASI